MNKLCNYGMDCKLARCQYSHSNHELQERTSKFKCTRACKFGVNCSNDTCLFAHTYQQFRTLMCPFDTVGCSMLSCWYKHSNSVIDSLDLWKKTIRNECGEEYIKKYPEIYEGRPRGQKRRYHDEEAIEKNPKLNKIDCKEPAPAYIPINSSYQQIDQLTAANIPQHSIYQRPEGIAQRPEDVIQYHPSYEHYYDHYYANQQAGQFIDNVSHSMYQQAVQAHVEQSSQASLQINLHVEDINNIPVIIETIKKIQGVNFLSMNMT